MQGSKTMPSLLTLALLTIGLVSVFYFSWVPNPNIGSKTYLPKWLCSWINYYGNVRTAVPFLFLAGLLESRLTTTHGINKKRIIILLGLIATVTLAEVGQLFLPMRHFDVLDILWGTGGSIVGISIVSVCKLVLQNNAINRK